MYYFPPAHPRGLPFKQALRELDYGGSILFILSSTLILTGIVYTTTLSSSSPRVIGTLVSGFALLVIFALYETFAPLKQPLTPRRVFLRGNGRELTAPFVAAFVVTMFYYAINVIFPTMISVLFTDANTSLHDSVVLTLPSNLGLVFGAFLLTVLGSKIGHWKWTLTASVTIMVVFGALLALVTPERKGLAIALVFLEQVGFGWAQYLSMAFVQFGTDQVELGIAGGLAYVSNPSPFSDFSEVEHRGLTALLLSQRCRPFRRWCCFDFGLHDDLNQRTDKGSGEARSSSRRSSRACGFVRPRSLSCLAAGRGGIS